MEVLMRCREDVGEVMEKLKEKVTGILKGIVKGVESDGPDCPYKPADGRRNTCPNYEVRHGASIRVKGKCPKHQQVQTTLHHEDRKISEPS